MRASFRWIILGLWMSGCVACSWAADVRVFAAISLSDSLKAIADAYREKTADRVVFDFGASTTLARQIEAGASADIFFSADEASMDALEKRQLLAPGTRRNLLSNQLVVVVPRDETRFAHSVAELAKPEVRRIAMGDPESVPVGSYGRRYFEKVGFWATLKPKIIPTENARATLAAVESGNVDAAVVYKTDAFISGKVKIAFEIKREEGPAIHYPLALLGTAQGQAAPVKFFDFLASTNAAQIFRRFGFIVTAP